MIPFSDDVDTNPTKRTTTKHRNTNNIDSLTCLFDCILDNTARSNTYTITTRK